MNEAFQRVTRAVVTLIVAAILLILTSLWRLVGHADSLGWRILDGALMLAVVIALVRSIIFVQQRNRLIKCIMNGATRA
ncbi:MAG: hypothetical protein RLZZ26_546 [Candidatus Parcubacteria bacterium]|jgi:hypothetical protein